MLVVLHMVRGLEAAQRTAQRLKDEGLLVRIHPVYKTASDADNYFEIKVLKSELDEAHEILVEAGMM